MMDLIPLQYRIALVAFFVAVGGLGLFAYGHRQYAKGVTAGRAEVQAKWNDEKVQQQVQALAQAKTNAEETQRRLKAQQGAQHAFDQQIAAARRDAAAADKSAGELRDQLAYYVAAVKRGTGSDSAAVPVGASTGTALDLLADMQRRIDDAAGGIASFADRSRAAGLQCEAEHDSLTKQDH